MAPLAALVLGSGAGVAVSPIAARVLGSGAGSPPAANAPRSGAVAGVDLAKLKTPRSTAVVHGARGRARAAPNLPGTVAQVMRGDVTTASTASGTVQDMTQLPLNFSGSGTAKHVYASPGQHVRAGQLLATATDPSLEATVAKDQIALAVARVNLAKTLAPPTRDAIAAAQATLDQAQAKLAAMLAGGTPPAIAQAQASLDQAQAKLAALEHGASSSVLAAQANLCRRCGRRGSRPPKPCARCDTDASWDRRHPCRPRLLASYRSHVAALSWSGQLPGTDIPALT
ncbi:MAG TPA: hypothetical protein VK009_24655 [Chloroflexota bacterium]|nr:hypothetical protein [Chloroflexota bacterium]